MSKTKSLDGDSKKLGGADNITNVVVLVKNADGSSEVVNFTRQTPMPDGFVLKDCERKSSRKFKDVPKRLEWFFGKSAVVDGEGSGDGKPNDGMEGQAHE